MTTCIKNLKNNVTLKMTTNMTDNGDTFIIDIIWPEMITWQVLRKLRNLNGKVSKHGVKIIVTGKTYK